MAFEPVCVCVYVWRYLLYYFGFNRRTQQRVLAGIDYRLLASSDALLFSTQTHTTLSMVRFVCFFLCFPPLTVCVCVCGFQNLRIKHGKRSSQSQPFEVIQGSTAQGMIPLESASHLFLRCYSGCNCYCFELCSTAILACHLFSTRTYVFRKLRSSANSPEQRRWLSLLYVQQAVLPSITSGHQHAIQHVAVSHPFVRSYPGNSSKRTIRFRTFYPEK